MIDGHSNSIVNQSQNLLILGFLDFGHTCDIRIVLQKSVPGPIIPLSHNFFWPKFELQFANAINNFQLIQGPTGG